MRAKLIELLTEEEIEKLNKYKYRNTNIDNIELRDVDIKTLSDIALTLMETEYGDKMPACVLSAKAIEILNARAIRLNKGIF
jgi:hypothetical protein